jgi:hypothetical protein
MLNINIRAGLSAGHGDGTQAKQCVSNHKDVSWSVPIISEPLKRVPMDARKFTKVSQELGNNVK